MPDSRIEKWERVVTENLHGPNHATGKDRLAACIGSLILGREFGESTESYLTRTKNKDFYDWAMRCIGRT